MATFQAQVEGLTSLTVSTTPTTTELTTFLTDGAREIIGVLPPDLLQYCIDYTELNSSSAMNIGTDTDIGKIKFVTHSDGARYLPAREIPAAFSTLSNDSTSLKYFGTDSDPVFWVISDGTNPGLEVFPTPTSTKKARVHHIAYPAVAYGDSDIDNFPDNAEYLVVLYASIKTVMANMGAKSSDLPSLAFPALPSTPSSPSFSTPAISAVTVASTTLANLGVAPTYSKPTITTRVAFKAFYADTSSANPFGDNDPGALSISAVAPVVPSISTVSYTDYTSNSISVASVIQGADYPTYTSPTVGGATEELTATMTAIANDQVGTDADYLDFSDWFTALGEMIEDDEDIELASAQIEKINAYVNTYNIQMQDNLNTFNEASVKFQAIVQKAATDANFQMQKNIQEAQLLQQQRGQKATQDLQASIENNNRALTKFQAEASVYNTNVNKEVQEYSQKLARYSTEISTLYQSWAKTESDSLQQFSIDIQNELNEFNKENASYQVKLQEAIQQAQINAQKAQQQSQLDATDAQQEASLKLQKENQEYAASLSKFQSEVQEYSAEVQSKVQDFTLNLQKHTTDYQWLESQYMQLKTEYKQGLQMLISGGLPQQQATQQERGR